MTCKRNTAISDCNHFVAQQDTITPMNRDINTESTDILEEELGEITASVKSYHFTQGS